MNINQMAHSPHSLPSTFTVRKRTGKHRYMTRGSRQKEAARKLMRIVDEEVRKRRRLLLLLPILYLVYLWMYAQMERSAHALPLEGIGEILSLIFFMIFLVCLFAGTVATDREEQAAFALSDLTDVRTVGALAEALSHGSEAAIDAAQTALPKALSGLNAGNAALLGEKTLACLRHVLIHDWAYRPDCVIAVLRALTRIEDHTVLPYVEAIARRTPFTPQEARVRRAARACLASLRRFAEKESLRQTLLRPAEVRDMLLRGAEAIPYPPLPHDRDRQDCHYQRELKKGSCNAHHS
jgi:hypothetical protein